MLRVLFCRVGADNVIHFALGTVQIVFNPKMHSISKFPQSLETEHLEIKSIWNIGRVICVTYVHF